MLEATYLGHHNALSQVEQNTAYFVEEVVRKSGFRTTLLLYSLMREFLFFGIKIGNLSLHKNYRRHPRKKCLGIIQ